MASISVSGVRKVFPNGFEALHEVDLEIADGEFIVLVGPSGCGKSTLLRLIAGLEPVTSGTIRIDGRDVTDEPPAQRDIAMVFQSYALYPHMHVRDNLSFGLRGRRTPVDVIVEKVDGVSRALGLRGLLERRPGLLSGGQRQRVAIGRAMVREPVAYLMDEPLSNLDAKLRVSMRAELARLHDRLGVTTVYVTHDQVEAMTLGDRVCVMLDGTIQQVDTPTRLFQSPVNTFVAAAIGSPAMNLVHALVEGDVAAFGDFRITLPASLRQQIGDRQEVVLGLRPTDFRLRAADFSLDDEQSGATAARLPVVAETVELLGAEQMVVFPVDAPRYTAAAPMNHAPSDTDAAQEGTLLVDARRTRFTARLDMRRLISRGLAFDLWFDAERLYVFDAETGRSLKVAEPATAVPAAPAA
jgi:multiple sugar transport system ATP-binding protein